MSLEQDVQQFAALPRAGKVFVLVFTVIVGGFFLSVCSESYKECEEACSPGHDRNLSTAIRYGVSPGEAKRECMRLHCED
jgi:hypothetical protein